MSMTSRGALPASILAAAALLQAQTPGETAFRTTVQPVLAKYCYSCHNDKAKAGNLSLEAYRDPAIAAQHPGVWDKVLDKLSAAKMPPPGLPAPTSEERAAIEAWATAVLPAVSAAPNPGRVTARRLNRAEYDNTIRDLLGVAMRPAGEFPVDDSGNAPTCT